jgi:hypothetical protein
VFVAFTVGGTVGGIVLEGEGVVGIGVGVASAVAVTSVVGVWLAITIEGATDGVVVALSTATAVAVTTGSDWQPASKKGNKTIIQQQRR